MRVYGKDGYEGFVGKMVLWCGGKDGYRDMVGR